MREVDYVEMMHIVSEPGDMTRYDYFVFQDGDEFIFMPCRNTFNYPQRISRWDKALKEVTVLDASIQDIADKFRCNPHTVLECLKTIRLIIGEEK